MVQDASLCMVEASMHADAELRCLWQQSMGCLTVAFVQQGGCVQLCCW
jgi:hypothetical protein